MTTLSDSTSRLLTWIEAERQSGYSNALGSDGRAALAADIQRVIDALDLERDEDLITISNLPRMPDSLAEQALEMEACGVANDRTLPIDVRQVVAKLWREVCARDRALLQMDEQNKQAVA